MKYSQSRSYIEKMYNKHMPQDKKFQKISKDTSKPELSANQSHASSKENRPPASGKLPENKNMGGSISEMCLHQLKKEIQENIRKEALECCHDPTLFAKNKLEWIYKDLGINPSGLQLEDFHAFQNEMVGSQMHSDESKFEVQLGTSFDYCLILRNKYHGLFGFDYGK